MWPLEGIACVGRRALFVVFEALLLVVTIAIGCLLIRWVSGDRTGLDRETLALAAVLAGVCQAAFYYADLYGPWNAPPAPHIAERLFRGLGIAAIVLAVSLPGLPLSDEHATAFLVAVTFPLLVIPGSRHQYAALIRWVGLPHRVLVLGGGPAANATITEMTNRPELGYEVVDSLKAQEPGAAFADLGNLLTRERVDIVVVALEDRRESIPLEVHLACRTAGITVVNVDELYERVTGRVLLDRLAPSMLLYGGTPVRRVTAAVKRIIDVLVSAVLLAVAAPVLAVVALLIKWDSPGPVLYTQERVGLRGRPFTIYKLRSMRSDAEGATGPVWAAGDDPRVTRIGRFLRASRLDECPQLWNVIKGDMSLVGPRPERPVFVDQLSRELPYYANRHLFKPGVTGWAQVSYPYGASVDDARAKLTYDLYYVLRWSIAFDLLIIIHTIKIVLRGRGAR